MTVKLEIPVIDLAGSERSRAEREKLCKEIARACEDWGFFQVINHGIDESLRKRALDVYTEFFYLPTEEKRKVIVPEGSIDGWMHPTLKDAPESLKSFTGQHTMEFLNNCWLPDTPENRRQWPTSPPSFQPTVLEFVQAAKGLHEKLIRMMAEGLGLDSEAFLTHLLTPELRMRGNFYPLVPEGTEVGPNRPHSDPPATTLLCDTASGLEVMRDGTWVQVQSVTDGFIVNVGDQIEILSNGKFKSIRHRVGGYENKERLSLACFYAPEDDAVIAPLEKLLVNGQRPKYRTYRYGDYFKSFVTKGISESKMSQE